MDKRNYTVYKHVSPSNKVYIGITSKTPEKRWRKGNGYWNNKYFYNAIQKYGWDNIKHEIVCSNLTKKEAEQKEIELIAYYDSANPKKGYNGDFGGVGSDSVTDAIKEKISRGNKGKIISKETRLKISNSTKGVKKAKFSKEALEKMSKSHIGKKLSEETKEKIKENSKRIKVCQYSLGGELIEIYNGQREAARKSNVDSSSISKCCKGKVKTAGGYIWKYYDEKEFC